MASIGPVKMEVVGDAFVESSRILAILWVGATTAADTVRINHRDTPPTLLWEGRTDGTNTYLGANFGTHGVHAPTGFRLAQISAGRVLVYLRED